MTENTQNKLYPLITIGICCYNSEDTVARAINSALAQDYPNFEVIVVDDGSYDKTPEIIQNTIKNYNNACFIQHKTNKTFPGALNTVIKKSHGEFIAIFDDDDESMPNRLSVQHRTMINYEDKTGAKLVACWGSGIRKYPNGYDIEFQAIGSHTPNPIGTTVIDYLLYYGKRLDIFYGNGTPSCSLMTRKSTYDAVGYYDETMFRSEDSDFSIRLALKGGHFIGCKENVITQYSTGGADKSAQRVYDSYKILMEKYRDYLISKKRFDYAMTWNKLRLYHFSNQKFKAIFILIKLFIKYPRLTWKHFWSTAPRRIFHEWKMSRKLH